MIVEYLINLIWFFLKVLLMQDYQTDSTVINEQILIWHPILFSNFLNVLPICCDWTYKNMFKKLSLLVLSFGKMGLRF